MAEPRLQRVHSVRLSDQASNQLRELILDGQFQPGQRLPSEFELTAMLNVSRSSVREALRSLESKGLIQVRSGSGAYVADHPFAFGATGEAIEWLLQRRESLDQILQVREVLEGLAASILASTITDKTLAELERILKQQKEAEALPAFVDEESLLDIQFHQIIARDCGNQMVADLVCSIVSAFSSGNRAVLYVEGKIDKSLSEHERIVKALAAHDPTRAEAAMRAHIARVHFEVENVQRSKARTQ